MNITKKVVTGLLISLPFTLSAKPKCTVESLGWLNGRWISSNEKHTISEAWETVSPLTMEGTGYTQKTGKAEKSYETLRIAYMSGQLYFIAKVGHNEFPVPFKATGCSTHSIKFENKHHDFPNTLHYQRKDDTLTVAVEDNNNEGFELRFEMKGGSPVE